MRQPSLLTVVVLSLFALNLQTEEPFNYADNTSIGFPYPVHLFEKGEDGHSEKGYLLRKIGGDTEGRPIFSMWVNSVICKDESCEVVRVELSWDSFGRYKSFIVEDGEHLTKLYHEDFTRGDYRRLQEILLDKTSALAEVDRDSLIKRSPLKKTQPEVDGMTGATTLFLRNDVIPGAAYTCFHLWDLANKRVPSLIRSITIKETIPDLLISFLTSEDHHENVLALEAFEARKIIRKDIFPLINEMIAREHHEVVPAMMSYLEVTDSDSSSLNQKISELFSVANEKQRVAMLDWLTEKPTAVEKELLLRLCEDMSKLSSFREVQLLLRLCEKHGVQEEKLLPHVFQLLSHKKFFVQRRAYHFLSEKTLSSKDQAALKEYYQKNQDRL